MAGVNSATLQVRGLGLELCFYFFIILHDDDSEQQAVNVWQCKCKSMCTFKAEFLPGIGV